MSEMNSKIINYRYQILKQLGEGGTSFVYQALDLTNNQPVVIKLMKVKLASAYLDDLIRFKRELEVIAGLNHPGIVKVFGAGEFETRPYLVMEFLAGNSLADRLEQKYKFSVETTVRIIVQLAETLNYIHSYGIIHRDIKPGNIYLTGPSPQTGVKILDFGVSHIIELGEIKDQELIVGTFGYMSPEATGILNRKVDERSDLYSLGVVFYQLLTGALPFSGIEVKQILHQQAALSPPRPGELNGSIPVILDTFVMKLLNKDPDQRYQSASGLLSDLWRYLQGETEFNAGEKDQRKKITFHPAQLAGRALELSKIRSLLEQAAKGKGSLCLITGEAGIGKSRLVEESGGDIYRQNGLFIRGRCLNHQNKAPYQPFRDASDGFLQWLEKAPPELKGQTVARLREVLGDLGQIAVQFNPRLECLAGQVKPLVSLEPERENQRFLMVLAAFFCRLAEPGKPAALFLDDLQWADEGTVSLLEEIIGNLHDSGILLLVTSRNDESGNKSNLERIVKIAREKNSHFEELQLTPLDSMQMNNLMANIFDAKTEFTPELNNFLLEKSRGNPFFAINIIREMVEGRAISWTETHLEVNWEVTRRITIPETVVDIILRRMESLSPEQIDILGKGAVIGREFEIQLLFKLSNLGEDRIVNLVDEIIALQLLEKGGERGRLLFAHDRIRDAFYYQLDPTEKQRFHLEIATVLEELHRDNPEKVLFELAYHYLEGGAGQKALEYTFPAAVKAQASYANEEAIRYYQKTIELLETEGMKGNRQWIRAKQELLEINLIISKYAETVAIAKDLLLTNLEDKERVTIYGKVTMAYFRIGDWAKGAETLRQGLALLNEKIPQSALGLSIAIVKELLVRLRLRLTPGFLRRKSFNQEDANRAKKIIYLDFCVSVSWLYGMGDSATLLYIIIRMLNLAETKIGKSQDLTRCLTTYAVLWATIPCFKIAIKVKKKALMINQENKDRYWTACSIQALGYFNAWMGDHETSIHLFKKGQSELQKIGDLFELGQGLIGLAINYLHISDYRNGAVYANKYLETCGQIKDLYGIMCAKIILANLQIESGEYVRAEEIITNAIRFSAEDEVQFPHCLAQMSKGYLELEKGNYDEAITHLETAREILLKTAILKDFVVNIFPLLAEAYLKKICTPARRGEDHGDFKKSTQARAARRLVKDALWQTRAWPNHYGIALRVAADYYKRLDQNHKAEKYYLKSIQHNEKIHRRYEAAKGYWEYGNFLRLHYRGNEANLIERQAYEIFKAIGAGAYLKKALDSGLLVCENPNLGELTTRERLTSERRKNAIITTARSISSILNIDILLDQIMDSAMELAGAERGILLLYPETPGGRLEPKVIRNISPSEIAAQSSRIGVINISSAIISKVEKTGEPLIVGNALADENLKNRYSVVVSGIRSVICTPIMFKGEMLGIIYLDNRLICGLFDQEDLEILDLLASQAGVSIENARLCHSLEQRVNERTEQLASANRELQRKNAELSSANERLKEHAATVAELATIKERNRLAMDVHDTIGHTMTLLLKLLEVSKIVCRKDPAKTEAELGNAINITREGLKEVRCSVSGLMAERLETNNLPAALERLIAGFASSGVAIDLMIEGDVHLPDITYSDVIYRTCQEALTNALRHGKAKTVAVILKFKEDLIRLYIIDDGCGCKEVKKGVGLSGMEKRIKGLNGNFQFSSDGESGFIIQVEIPVGGGYGG
ncbi:MAG TPA: protein kinase [Bacillota bacterium]|nr:protein kinase [Bacillota bacterium]